MRIFKFKKSLTALVAGLATASIVFASTAFAGSPGQLAQGAGLYQVKNLTTNGSYASSISVAACTEVKYSMMLSNTDFSALNSVTLTATLSSNGGTSVATATTELGGFTGTHDSVNVTIPSGYTMSYVAGTTQLYDGNGNFIKNLPDTITSTGVNVGTINGSTTEFVNFKAKVSCPTPTPTPTPTPVTPTVVTTTKALPNTGAGDVLGLFTGASAAGTAVHYAVSRRRR